MDQGFTKKVQREKSKKRRRILKDMLGLEEKSFKITFIANCIKVINYRSFPFYKLKFKII